MTSADLKNYILEEDKIEYILESLGCHSIKFHEDKELWTASFPDGDNVMGVCIKCNSNLSFYSYSRGIHIEQDKDIFDLIENEKGFSFGDAIKWVHDILGLKYTFLRQNKPSAQSKEIDISSIFKRVKTSKRKRNVLEFEPLSEDALEDFVPMVHIDIFREGIIPRTIKKFGLCYSYKWKRTIYPHRYWNTGELMGFNGRTSVENYDEFGIKKYFISRGMPKEINLYGLYENYDSIQKAGYVVVYESEKSVLKRDSLFDETGVAISGHSISDEQARILIGLNVDIIVSFDNDVDINEVRYNCEKLCWRGRNVYYTYDKHGIMPEKSAIADCKRKVFDYLMKHKVKYDNKEHQLYLNSLKK